MKSTQQALGPLRCVVVDGSDAPSVPVILCHGFGAPGHDLVPIGQAILQSMGERGQRFRFVFPEAPHSLAAEGMPEGRAWWPLNMQRLMQMYETNDFSELRTAEPPGLDEAREMLMESIEAVVASMAEPGPLILGGFSQGAMLTMDTTLRGLADVPSGLVQFSGTLICEAIWQQQAQRLCDARVIQSHGRDDFILPYTAATWLRALIEPHAKSHSFIPFDGGHGIPPEAMQGFMELLDEI